MCSMHRSSVSRRLGRILGIASIPLVPLVLFGVLMSGLVAFAQSGAGQTPSGDPIVCPDGSARRWSIFAGGQVTGRFDDPRSILIDRDGNLLVLDSGNHRIQKLSPAGDVLAVLGEYGAARGKFELPHSLALDGDGNLYVSDHRNRRVQKLSPDGTSLGEWKAQPRFDRTDYEPTHVAVGGGNLYAYYTSFRGPTQLQRIGPTGEELILTSIQRIQRVSGMAADSAGNLYVTDRDDGLLYRIDQNDQILDIWGKGEGGSALRLQTPGALALGPDGVIYVVDQDGRRIQGVSPSGEVRATWTSPVPVKGIAVSADGSLFVTLDGPAPIAQIAPTGGILKTFGVSTDAPGIVSGAQSVVVDPSGNVVVLQGDRLQTFTSAGTFVGERSLQGIVARLTELDARHAMTMTDDGSLYIVASDRTVVKLTPDGTVAGRWDIGRGVPGAAVEGAGDNTDIEGRPEPRSIRDIAVDAAGNVYIADGPSLHKLAPDGTRIARWFAQDVDPMGPRADRFLGHHVAVDQEGHLYVAAWSIVFKLTPSGSLVSKFGNPPGPARQSGPGTFGVINDVAVDRQANVFVVNDSDSHPVQLLGPKNELLVMWGSGEQGAGDPLSSEPRRGAAGIVVNSAGEAFLAAGDRILKLGCPGAS